jgi:hypothetical protein
VVVSKMAVGPAGPPLDQSKMAVGPLKGQRFRGGPLLGGGFDIQNFRKDSFVARMASARSTVSSDGISQAHLVAGSYAAHARPGGSSADTGCRYAGPRALRRGALEEIIWRTSARGNPWTKIGPAHIVIFPSRRTEGEWSLRLEYDGRVPRFLKRTWPSAEEARQWVEANARTVNR